jgi:hypothetical protein
MAMKDPDDALVVLFKHHAVRNTTRSLAEGREIYDDVEIVEIRFPGSKDVKAFPATARSHWLDNPFTGEQTQVTYAERFARQYQQFKARTAQTKSGTPLDLAPFLTESKRAELRAQNVYTVEQLAAIDGTELKNLGPYGRDLKNGAVAFIDESRAGAPNLQMAAELEALRARNAVLEEDAQRRNAQAQEAGKISETFDEMTTEQLREYITTHTGQAPVGGNLNHKALKRLASEVRPSKAA